MQFSAIVNRFIVKTYLNSAFTNDLKRKLNFRKMFVVADLVSLKVMGVKKVRSALHHRISNHLKRKCC